jgi:hypothetical protein
MQNVIERDDLRPIGFPNAGRPGVNSRDSRLQDMGSDAA